MANSLDMTPKSHAKVVETENAMILMGNYYQKEDLSCVSKQGCIFDNITVGNDTLNISRYMSITGAHRLGERNKQLGIVKDPYLSNRYYYSINNHYANVSSTLSYLISAEEEDNDLVIIAKASVSNIEWREVFDIDENYLYVSGTHLANGGVYIYKINKNTCATSVIFQITQTNRAKCNLIRKDETYLYFIVGGVNAATTFERFYLVRYNKNNGEVKSTLYTPPKMKAGTTEYEYNSTALWMSHNNMDIEDFYQEGSKYYFCYPQRSGAKLTEGEGNANNNLMIVCYDSSKAFDDAGVITFRTSNGIQDNEKLLWANNNGYSCYRFWIIGTYLYYAVYDETNNYPIMNDIQGIHVFKIKHGFELEYIDKIQITTRKQIISMLYNSTKDMLLVGYLNSFEIYKYNETTHLYEALNKEITDVTCAGFDAMDRLWYRTSTSSVHVENLDDPQYVTIKFEKIYYTYEGEKIDTYLTFEAQSFTDKVPEGKYTLTLAGNAYFKDNYSQEMVIMYTGGTVQKDIVITGPKRVICSAVFQKVW